MAETKKNAQSKQCSPMGSLLPLQIFTLKMGTPCLTIEKIYCQMSLLFLIKMKIF